MRDDIKSENRTRTWAAGQQPKVLAEQPSQQEPVSNPLTDAQQRPTYWLSRDGRLYTNQTAAKLHNPYGKVIPVKIARQYPDTDCTNCKNSCSLNLPDKPICKTCHAGSHWTPLNIDSVNPNKPAQQHDRVRELECVIADLKSECQALRAEQPVSKPLTPEWIWSWLMDWCRKNGTSPANYNSLFKMVNDARAIEAAHGIKE